MNKKLHIGLKLVLATAMARGDYNEYRGWELPADEAHLANEDGFLVEYVDGGNSNHPEHDGYISWSPKTVFDNAYKASGEMSFGMAIEAARRGYKVARKGWNGTGMFAYIVPAAKYKPQTSAAMDMTFDDGLILYREYWALFTAQKDVATWQPSGSDSLANDWVIYEGFKSFEEFAAEQVEQSQSPVDEYGIIEILKKHNAEGALNEIAAVFDRFCESYMGSREDIRKGAFTEINCYLMAALYESHDDTSLLRSKVEGLVSSCNDLYTGKVHANKTQQDTNSDND